MLLEFRGEQVAQPCLIDHELRQQAACSQDSYFLTTFQRKKMRIPATALGFCLVTDVADHHAPHFSARGNFIQGSKSKLTTHSKEAGISWSSANFLTKLFSSSAASSTMPATIPAKHSQAESAWRWSPKRQFAVGCGMGSCHRSSAKAEVHTLKPCRGIKPQGNSRKNESNGTLYNRRPSVSLMARVS